MAQEAPGGAKKFVPIGPPMLPTAGGQSLPPPLRHRMEAAFGADFSDVRIHEHHAATHAGGPFVRANAIYSAPGTYDPRTQGGQEILAHELTHVVQQGGGTYVPDAPPQRRGRAGPGPGRGPGRGGVKGPGRQARTN